MDPAIDIRHLSFTDDGADRPALDDISLSVARGECLLVTGPAGAGKSTLCLCLNGLVPQVREGRFAGEIRVAGDDVSRFRVQTLSKTVGLVMQDPEAQLIGRTVAEDLAFGPRNFLVPGEKIPGRMSRARTLAGLSEPDDQNTEDLSGGEKQRLAVAGILAMAPPILVMDEPASALDPAGRTALYQNLSRLNREDGVTLIIVEHRVRDLLDMADRVVTLDGGRLIKITDAGTFSALPAARPRSGRPPLPNRRDPMLLEVRNLSFTPGRPVLDGVDFRVHQTDFIALMGHNGAGKTSLVKHFNGLLPVRPNTVFFRGRDISAMPVRELIRGVGLVFQNPDHQIFEATVEKEVGAGLAYRGLLPSQIKARVSEVLEYTGLTPVRTAHPLTLSKGMRQMVAVASIVVLRPEILVVDEPSAGLDAGETERVMGILDRLHRGGTAVVCITHDLELAAVFARRLVLMKKGCIVLDTDVDKALENTDALETGEAFTAGSCPEGVKGRACEPKPSGLAALDIRTKCSLFILVMAWTVLFSHPACHGVLLILAAGIGPGLKQMFRRILPLTPLFLIILIFAPVPGTMVHPENGEVFFSLGGYYDLTRGGLFLGMTFILRLVNMIFFTRILMGNTTLDEVITLFTMLRLPRPLALAVTTAIRFIPELDRKRRRIMAAQRARGIDPESRGWLKRFHSRAAVMIPLIVNAILVADQLTMALMNRGYGYRNRWTVTEDLKFRVLDYAILVLFLAGLSLALFVRFKTGWGRL